MQFLRLHKELSPGRGIHSRPPPKNYYPTFSAAETSENHQQAKLIARLGGNVAVLFDRLPKTFWGLRVVDGDVSDLRFLDQRGVIVGLKAKGAAKRDATGFVVTTV